jgi:uroporphyrinogen-III synthase
MRAILITRPIPAAQRTAQELRQLGYTPLIAPALTLSPIPIPPLTAKTYQGVIFTSAAAITHFAAHCPNIAEFQNLPALCVGKQTQRSASQAGWDQTFCADGDAQDLLKLIKTHHGKTQPPKPYLYLRAKETAQPLEDWLSAAQIAHESHIIYESLPAEELPADIIDALKNNKVSAVLFFSAHTAKNFKQLIRKHALEAQLRTIKALSISAGVLGCVQDLPWRRTGYAVAPNAQALYTLLQKEEPNGA